MDPTENKDKFSTGFREVQESFYDLCGKLEKTQDCFPLFIGQGMQKKVIEYFTIPYTV